MSFLTNIQNKSHVWKKKFALVITIILTFILAVVWLSYKIPQTVNEIENKKDSSAEVVSKISGPFESMGNKFTEIKAELNAIIASFSKIKVESKMETEDTSTTSSSTDLVQ